MTRATRPVHHSATAHRSNIRVGAIAVPAAPENIVDFEFALDECTWGSPTAPKTDDDEAPRTGDILLIATGYSRPDPATSTGINRSPRVTPDVYLQGSFERIIMVEVTGDPYESTNPHWPGEDGPEGVRYPYRFPISTLSATGEVKLADLPDALATNFHRSINSGSRALVTSLSREEADHLAARAEAEGWNLLISTRPKPSFDMVSRRGLHAEHIPESRARGTKSSGQGRQQDPEKKKATELYAEDVAIRHYERLGWNVRKEGAPFDLDCTRGAEKLRVEVKGTTGGAGDVQLTVGEVESAENYPTELFVVFDIKLAQNGEMITTDSRSRPVSRTTYKGVPDSGTAKVFLDWKPVDDDLVAKTFSYRVPWHLAEDPESITP